MIINFPKYIRHQVYQDALRFIKREKKAGISETMGLCNHISDGVKSNPYISKEIKYFCNEILLCELVGYFPEIVQFRPYDESVYWWPQKDYDSREKALEQAIRETMDGRTLIGLLRKKSTIFKKKPSWTISLTTMMKRYKTDNVGWCYFKFFAEKYHIERMTDEKLNEMWEKEFGEQDRTPEQISSMRKVYKELEDEEMMKELAEDCFEH